MANNKPSDTQIQAARKKSAPSSDVWMPIYWGDYFKNTRHLTAAQHGGYMCLIGAYWTSRSPLHDDDRRLAMAASMSKSEWKKNKQTISEFFHISDGFWFHHRIDEELKIAEENITRSKDRTAAATAARAEKRAKNDNVTYNVTSNVTLTPARGEGEGPSGNKNSVVSKIGTTSSDGEVWGVK